MADTRSAAEIENEIEQDRAALDESIAELRGRFTFQEMGNQLTDTLRTNGGEIAGAVSRSVKENPIALALSGIGLAWMIFGTGPSSREISYRARRSRDAVSDKWSRSGRDYGSDFDDDDFSVERTGYGTDRTRDYAASATGATRADFIEPRGPRPASDLPLWARGRPHDTYSDEAGHLDDPYVGLPARSEPGDYETYDYDDEDGGPSAMDRARTGVADAGSSVRGAATSAGASVRGAAASASSSTRSAAQRAGSSARNAVSSVRSSADRARMRIAAGTDRLSEDARERVIAARLKAIELRDEADHRLRQGGQVAADYYDRQPLVFGALALAVGAAIGAGLPHTRREDEWLGKSRDQMLHEAERILQGEVARAQRIAEAVGDEASKIAGEAKGEADKRTPGDKDAANSLADKAEEAAGRIRDRAVDEANKGEGGTKT